MRAPAQLPSDPREWQLAIRVLSMPADANAFGDVFGGWLMAQVDIAGSVVAVQVASGRVATVAINAFQFIQPVLVGDLVSIYSRLQRVGRTSITVEVEAYCQREQDLGTGHQVASAVLTYVAVGEAGRPREVGSQWRRETQ
jgi:acyl-CoA thioesterase YciA